MRYGRLALVAAVAVASACAQIAGLGDPSELESMSAPDATTGLDVTTTTEDRAVPPPDGPVVEDAGAEASCATAIFCEDFDTDASVAQWMTQDSGTGSVSLVGNPVRSPPRSLRATNAGSGNAQLARIVPITEAITCEMSVRAAAWSGEGYFFELGLDPANKGGFSYWWIDVGKQAGQALLLEYSYDGANATSSTAYWDAPQANTWVRVRVDVRLRGSGPTSVRVLFDGVPKAERNIAVPPATSYRLAIGIGTDKSATADDVFIDDVICSAL